VKLTLRTTSDLACDCNRSKVVAAEVKKNGAGETERVDSIENTAVSFDHRSVVLHAAIAFDRGHREAAEKSEKRDDQRHRRSLPWLERRRPPQRCAERGRGEHAADESS